MSEPPSDIWFLGVAGLVWHRAKLAFVPWKPIMGNKKLNLDDLNAINFPTEQAAQAQLDELKAIGVWAKIEHYAYESTRPDSET